MEVSREEVQAAFPWISGAQAWSVAFNARRFFGFDAKERPVLRRENGDFTSLNRHGNPVAVARPITRAFFRPAELKLRAVLVVEFTVAAEFASEEELLAALSTGQEGEVMRNNIARRVEATTTLLHADARGVGWIDDNREIVISGLDKATVRGISKL